MPAAPFAATAANRAKMFVSYSRKDLAFAQMLVGGAGRARLKCDRRHGSLKRQLSFPVSTISQWPIEQQVIGLSRWLAAPQRYVRNRVTSGSARRTLETT
jgi:hypothetical protein